MNKFARAFPARSVLLASLALVASVSQAAAIDVTAVTTDMTAQLTPIAAIGAGVLLIMVAVKAFKWVRAALG